MRSISLLSLGLVMLVATRADAGLVSGINAIVNEAVITYQEVEFGIRPGVELLLRQHGRDPQRLEQEYQKLRSERIEQLVERQLILHEFASAGYQLPESFVDDSIQDRIRQQFGDRVTLTKTLQAQGKTFESFRKEEREEIIVTLLRRQNISAAKILISPYKIETYYTQNQESYKVGDQVKLRMIVLNQTPGAPEAARNLAREILKKVSEGASFAEMATVYSEGAQREQGGDRGWIERTFLRSELSDVAFSLKPGQNSDVIELPEACYLLKVEETRPAHTKPLEEVRSEIEDTLKAQERARLHAKWIGRLKHKSFIRYF